MCVSNEDLSETMVADKPDYLCNPFSIELVEYIIKQKYGREILPSF